MWGCCLSRGIKRGMAQDLTDAELPGYARIHCRTDRALFHAKHLRRLLELAKLPVPEFLLEDGWYAVFSDTVDPILDQIPQAQGTPQ